MRGKRKGMLTVLFFIYLAVLTWAILFKMHAPTQILAERLPEPILNLRPFYRERTGAEFLSFQIQEIRDNILLFIPMGLYLSLLWRKGTWYGRLLAALAVSLALETAQYSLRIGRADITDLITNGTGALMGLGGCKLAEKLLGKRTESALTYTALVCTVLVLALLSVLIIGNR